MKSRTSHRSRLHEEVYKDPIYGIPHFHDPALSRLILKHDPSHHVSESMKLIFMKSDQRLRSIHGNKPKYLHKRFNMDTLTTSPLMAFPHFQDMAGFLSRWFTTRDSRQQNAFTSHQRATFEAQERFSRGLFLLLQESARAAPISPKPLKGIYNWYLQRDSVINQSRTIERKTGLDEFIVIELSNGQEIRVSRALLDGSQTAEIENLFDVEFVKKTMKEIEVEVQPEPEIESTPIIERQVEVITSTGLPTQLKKGILSSNFRRPTFDFDQLHAELEGQRQNDKDVTAIAKIVRERRRAEILQLEGWQ
jgi:hypothetical protein